MLNATADMVDGEERMSRKGRSKSPCCVVRLTLKGKQDELAESRNANFIMTDTHRQILCAQPCTTFAGTDRFELI